MKLPSALCCLIALPLFAHEPGRPGSDIAFEKVTLTQDFYSEGACFADFNKDGKFDVASGPFWYPGPDFKTKQEIYPVVPVEKDGVWYAGATSSHQILRARRQARTIARDHGMLTNTLIASSPSLTISIAMAGSMSSCLASPTSMPPGTRIPRTNPVIGNGMSCLTCSITSHLILSISMATARKTSCAVSSTGLALLHLIQRIQQNRGSSPRSRRLAVGTSSRMGLGSAMSMVTARTIC